VSTTADDAATTTAPATTRDTELVRVRMTTSSERSGRICGHDR
jgi:hypothetical protein